MQAVEHLVDFGIGSFVNRQNLSQILKWIVSIAILCVLLWSFDAGTLVHSFLNANVPLLCMALAIGFASICLSVYRWQASLAVQDIQVPFRILLSSTLVSGFLGFLLPSFGEDAVRGYDLYKYSSRKGVNIAASILFERICGLLGQVIIGGVALAYFHERISNRTVVHSVIGLYLCVVFALFVVFSSTLSRLMVSGLERIRLLSGIAEKVSALTAAVHLYRNHLGAWVSVLGISLVFQFAGFLYFFVIAKALAIDVGLSTFILLVPIVTILSLLPISVGGLGVKEGLFVVLFTQLGVTRESAFLTSAMGSGLHITFVLLGGLIFVLRRHSAQPEPR